MNCLKINLLVISIIFSVSVFTFGQKQSPEITKNKTQSKSAQTQIPKGWKSVDLGYFSFILPESMEDKKARGIDSQVWRFEDDEIKLQIDRGMYEVDFAYGGAGFKKETKWIELDGVKGKFFTIDYTKSFRSKDHELSETQKEKPFLQAIVFYEDENSYSSFWVTYKKTEQKDIAEKILYSIKFKQK